MKKNIRLRLNLIFIAKIPPSFLDVKLLKLLRINFSERNKKIKSKFLILLRIAQNQN